MSDQPAGTHVEKMVPGAVVKILPFPGKSYPFELHGIIVDGEEYVSKGLKPTQRAVQVMGMGVGAISTDRLCWVDEEMGS